MAEGAETCEIPEDGYLAWSTEDTMHMMRQGESPREPLRRMKSMPKPKELLKIGTWNVRTMYQIGKTRQITNEMDNYNLDILGISEARWTGFGKIKTVDDKTILYSGAEDKHERGVALILGKKAVESLIGWEPISDRIIKARFFSKFIKMTIIQVYAPTNDSEESEKDHFYDQLQQSVDKVEKHDLLIVMGDLNAKVGQKICEDERSLGNEAVGRRNENGEIFVSFCEVNNLVIGGTKFKHKEIHKITWKSPDGRTKNQIDHIAINGRFARSMRDVRVKRGADVGSDHYLVVMDLKLRLKKCCTSKNRKPCGFDVTKLKDKNIKDKFIIELKNRFSMLEDGKDGDIQDINEVEQEWQRIEKAFTETAGNVIGKKEKRKSKEWISGETWKLIEKRKNIKNLMDCTKSERKLGQYRENYREANKNVKRNARKDKREYYESLAMEAQRAADNGEMKTIYQVIKQISGNRSKQEYTVKDKQGKIMSSEKDIENRWREHFKETLNVDNQCQNIQQMAETVDPPILPIPTGEISLIEIQEALKALKPAKACGGDQIAAEMLKVDIDATSKYLHPLFNLIWENEKIPERWRESIIVKIPKKGDPSICDNYRGFF